MGHSVNFKIPRGFLCRRPVFPDYLFVSFDYDITESTFLYFTLKVVYLEHSNHWVLLNMKFQCSKLRCKFCTILNRGDMATIKKKRLEAYLEPSETSKMELFAKMANDL